MLAVYVFAFIFGGVLLLISMLGLLGEHEVDGGAFFQGDHPVGEYLSLRTFLYFAAGFGATGTLLTLTGAPAGLAALLAVATGIAAALVSAALYRWLRSSESGVMPMSSEHLVGLEGEVVLPVRPGATGKVRVVSGNRALELLARCHGEEAGTLMRGTPIVILEVADGTALVAPATSLLPESH